MRWASPGQFRTLTSQPMRKVRLISETVRQTNIFGPQGSTKRHPNPLLTPTSAKYGLTIPPQTTEEIVFPETGGTESGTVGSQHNRDTRELRLIIERWPHLDKATKAKILSHNQGRLLDRRGYCLGRFRDSLHRRHHCRR